jgi:hypothetical protein
MKQLEAWLFDSEFLLNITKTSVMFNSSLQIYVDILTPWSSPS